MFIGFICIKSVCLQRQSRETFVKYSQNLMEGAAHRNIRIIPNSPHRQKTQKHIRF